jgi:hypothetical protein
MSDRKRTAESNASKFLVSEMLAPGPMRTLSDQMGPGPSEPEEGWKFPTGPLDELVGQADAIPEPVYGSGTVGLPRQPTRRG